jgi:hypothetical protein
MKIFAKTFTTKKICVKVFAQIFSTFCKLLFAKSKKNFLMTFVAIHYKIVTKNFHNMWYVGI